MMKSAKDYNARVRDRGLKIKSRFEFLAEHAKKGGTAIYPHPPIVVYTGSQSPRCRPCRAKNIESAIFGGGGELKKEVLVISQVVNSLSALPPTPPIHNNTRRRPKMTTNLTAILTKKCQACPELHPAVGAD